MNSSIIEFPVNVSRSEEGDYVARLVDLPEGADGPEGRGVDPYAALEDLTELAQSTLAQLHHNNTLPPASAVKDRPVISFDTAVENSPSDTDKSLAVGGAQPIQMLGYSWTNHTIFQDR